MAGDEFVNSTALTILLILLVTAVLSDLRTHRIPNVLVFPALALSLLVHTLGSGMEGLLATGAGLAVGMAMLLPFYLIGGMGAGDVKLVGVVGSLLGPWGALVTGIATLMAGAVLGIAVIVWQRCRPPVELYLRQVTGVQGNMLHATAVSTATDQTPCVNKIAYSPAIAAGTILALWYMGASPIQILG